MLQEQMIARVRQVCAQDPRLVAAMMYGSFARGEADQFSDIEFVLFFDDAALRQLDQRAWVEQIAPALACYTNEFGITAVVFDNLVRGEFHFDPASEMAKVREWRATDSFPSLDPTLILDRTGEFTPHLQQLIGPPPERTDAKNIRFVCDSLANWLLFGSNVLARGEAARALELLGVVQRYLLWIVRLSEGTTDHWPTPSKGLEDDISEAAYGRFVQCTASLDKPALVDAFRNAIAWGQELMEALGERYPVDLPMELLRRVATHFDHLWPPTPSAAAPHPAERS